MIEMRGSFHLSFSIRQVYNSQVKSNNTSNNKRNSIKHGEHYKANWHQTA